jgi:hypothetical protein
MQEKTIYTYKNYLMDPPNYGVFSDSQSKCIVCSVNDILFMDLNKGYELDIDKKENVGDILNIICQGKYFYVMANKKDDILGYYLFIINIDDPEGDYVYLINWKNKCNIRQVDLKFLQHNASGKENKLLAVSYAAEGLNTYNVFVFDIKRELILYWFEAFHLFESPIRGFLLKTMDYLIYSKEGCQVINIGSGEPKLVKDNLGDQRLMRSLGSVQYLKLEQTNHIYFKCQFYDNRRICIREQYTDLGGNTNFDEIYQIKLDEPTLRELLVLQSIFTCKTVS